MDERSFATAPQLRALNATVAGFGVRATGSPAHHRLISWLERRVGRLPGVSVPFAIQHWQPGPGLLFSGGAVPVAGAIPYSDPGLRSGDLVRLPAGTPITAANAGGKIVLSDFPALDRGYLAEPLLDADVVDAGKAGADADGGDGAGRAFGRPHLRPAGQ